ncbi:hypothetical protein [Thermomonospora umbrina]|uniref:Uncharacterized protein n=1 Tax=Thermomonospora umbrina TaxID=111806 RepID=A0A3D9SWF9_9ACTN|nr:hypothetical protein [Thermomonospora umbrina]REF00277.1 hypothetical protein DFJ69_5806 [Thermomonospora umbrina]
MARHLFGGIADFVVGAGDEVTVGSLTGLQNLLVPDQDVTFWTAPSGGVQYTDLLDLTDTPIPDGTLTTGSTGAYPQFRGPDGVTLMYADAGGARRAVVAVDLGADIASLLQRLAELEATVAEQQSLLTYALYGLRYDPGAGAYPSVPAELAGQQYLIWIGPPAPSGARTKDIHIDTVE